MKKILNIAIDGGEANVKHRVGSNVYAYEIIHSLYKLLDNHPNINIIILLSTKRISDLPEERKNWTYKIIGPQKFWTQWALPIYLFKNHKKIDVFFTPGHYAPRITSVPYVSTVMDTAFIDYPEQFKKIDSLKLTKWTEYSVKNAKKIITISEYSKRRVMKHYHKLSTDVVVAYPATNSKKLKVSAKELEKFFKTHNISGDFLLFVGTLQPRKNLIKLIEAFEIFSRMSAARGLKRTSSINIYKIKPEYSQDQGQIKLVLAGKVGWLADEIIKKIAETPVKNKIITTGFITEKEKQMLYKHAFATCLIGTHEGFGIPPLESLNFGTPPIVSNTTSLPEVVGDAGFLTNPNSSQDIANKIWEVFSLSSKEKGFLRKKARSQVKKFSWDKSAKIIFNTLLEVAENNR